MKTKEIDLLLADFDALPKSLKQPTYLELCKYPRRRFEEICSRLLCFYLAPKREHQLQDLFLCSLLQLLAPNKEFDLRKDRIHVISEENAEGKRLDMLVYSNTFVVGIENKITADLYNPLEIYKKQIQRYGNDNVYCVILSLQRLSSKEDTTFIKTHGFTNLTYTAYFKQIKENLPAFEQGCNRKYLNYLLDFIETLENMETNTIMNEELSDYFYDNSGDIDNLLILYNQFKNETKSKQKDRIADLKEKISESTNNKWWAWEGWDLGFNEFNSNKPKIGIESYFEATKGNPLGIFRITITAWSLMDWSSYEVQLLKDYSKDDLEKIGNRAFLRVEEIVNGSEEQILESLKKHYNNLVNLTSELG